jgi:hypothetical protein
MNRFRIHHGTHFEHGIVYAPLPHGRERPAKMLGKPYGGPVIETESDLLKFNDACSLEPARFELLS